MGSRRFIDFFLSPCWNVGSFFDSIFNSSYWKRVSNEEWGLFCYYYYIKPCCTNFVKIRKGIDAIVSKFESKEVGKKSCCIIGKIDVGIFLYVSRDILIGFF